MYEWDDDDGEETSRFRPAVIGAVLFGAIVVGWFVVRPALSDNDAATNQSAPFDPVTSTASAGAPETQQSVASTEPATTEPATTKPATTEPATTEPATTEPATTEPPTTGPAAPTTTTTAPPTTLATTALSPTTSAPTTTLFAAPYLTTPDGTPEPVVAIFDDDRITLVGAVPSQDAADTLVALAVANSQFPDVPVDNQLTINPSVPAAIGVRFLELNSVRFPEGSAQILPDHARQLDRVVDIMNAQPNITVIVVGHADQRGSDEANLLLSRQRAGAVVAYIVNGGIDEARLSARAAGESELLSVDDDEASLAINRRTEFIFFGLLVAPSSATTTTTTIAE